MGLSCQVLMPGGYFQHADPNNEEHVRKVAIMTLRLVQERPDQAACSLELDHIEEAWSQVVAGTNWKMTLALKKSCSGKDPKMVEINIFMLRINRNCPKRAPFEAEGVVPSKNY